MIDLQSNNRIKVITFDIVPRIVSNDTRQFVKFLKFNQFEIIEQSSDINCLEIDFFIYNITKIDMSTYDKYFKPKRKHYGKPIYFVDNVVENLLKRRPYYDINYDNIMDMLDSEDQDTIDLAYSIVARTFNWANIKELSSYDFKFARHKLDYYKYYTSYGDLAYLLYLIQYKGPQYLWSTLV